MASRCFPILNRDIEYSGDYTRSKKQSTIYKSLRNSIADNLNKIRKYENNYVISDTSGLLISANSHEALLDITKGKYYSNPLLTGASAAKYESWTGVFILSDLSGIASIQDLSWNTTDKTIKKGDYNIFQFPPPSQPDTKDWNTHAYPGFIIDPSNKILWQSCNENHTKLIAPITNTAKLDYKWTNGYWKAVSGQPLHGMSFPEKIHLSQQETNVNTLNAERFAPRPTFKEEEFTATNQYKVWCSGNFALK